MKSEPTFAIMAGTLWGNRGAEAMLVTTIGQIRRRVPDARFKVFSYYPAKDAQLCQDERVEVVDSRPLTLALRIVPLAVLCSVVGLLRIRLPGCLAGRQVRALRECDALLDIGGITFCDGREVFLLFNVLSVLPAILLGVPVFKLSQAMGPFRNPFNRLAAAWTLRRCQMVFSRGPRTSLHLRELGLPHRKWREASDVAFAYAANFSLTSENEQLVEQLESEIAQHREDAKKIVSIVPSSLLFKNSEGYLDKLVDLVRKLIETNVHVVVLPNATREGFPKTRNNDLVVIEQLLHLLSDDARGQVTAVTFDVNTASIRRLMRSSDLVVTSRFHGMVAALANAIPVIVIGWSHKYSEVLSQFNCDEFGLDHTASRDDIYRLVLRVMDGSPRIREDLQAALADVHSSAEDQFDETLRFLRQAAQQPAIVESSDEKGSSCFATTAHRSH